MSLSSQTNPHATVEIEISEDMQLVHFDFNRYWVTSSLIVVLVVIFLTCSKLKYIQLYTKRSMNLLIKDHNRG